ncbi:hypothetical protein GLYMA_14G089081v4 [Glycine max]|uniref:Uncharacterized protein n=1 Tax=Glycine max TaxID=3847 RepID=A0A0R0E3H1_SOYBN|nr:hypothetical protein GLYMA_14G089081v4 [Glycine max]KAH1079715.1 hypothetical protein GYH30_057277 [Glycine max]
MAKKQMLSDILNVISLMFWSPNCMLKCLIDTILSGVGCWKVVCSSNFCLKFVFPSNLCGQSVNFLFF